VMDYQCVSCLKTILKPKKMDIGACINVYYYNVIAKEITIIVFSCSYILA
jgi:hypothetical protein